VLESLCSCRHRAACARPHPLNPRGFRRPCPCRRWTPCTPARRHRLRAAGARRGQQLPRNGVVRSRGIPIGGLAPPHEGACPHGRRGHVDLPAVPIQERAAGCSSRRGSLGQGEKRRQRRRSHGRGTLSRSSSASSTARSGVPPPAGPVARPSAAGRATGIDDDALAWPPPPLVGQMRTRGGAERME
jgi:hypothetical protein